MSETENGIEVDELTVAYERGQKRVVAVNRLSFSVRRGECVGFIGPNGAGKTTTIKALMGFIFPQGGSVSVLGAPAGSLQSRRRIGYLPEVLLYYPFMRARELLQLYGGLQGMGRRALRQRVPELLALVGLEGKGETLLRHFSKGMQQRLGIAQAIIADPQLLVFDELSSGLDPLGRRDLRETLLDLKRRGKTIFFSSHELSEVETLCDRVVMIHQGRMIAENDLAELIAPLSKFEIVFTAPDGLEPDEWIADQDLERRGDHLVAQVQGSEEFSRQLAHLVGEGARIVSTQVKNISLEDHFIGLIRPRQEGQ